VKIEKARSCSRTRKENDLQQAPPKPLYTEGKDEQCKIYRHRREKGVLIGDDDKEVKRRGRSATRPSPEATVRYGGGVKHRSDRGGNSNSRLVGRRYARKGASAAIAPRLGPCSKKE